jgi:hypothetical protein
MRSAVLLLVVTACAGSGSGDLVDATVHRTGGFAPSGGSGSTCQAIDDTYTYDAATHIATWQRCEPQGAAGVDQFTNGQTTLPADTAAQLESALAGLRGGPTPCGGDIHDRIVITWATGITTFEPAQCAHGETAVFDILEGLN